MAAAGCQQSRSPASVSSLRDKRARGSIRTRRDVRAPRQVMPADCQVVHHTARGRQPVQVRPGHPHLEQRSSLGSPASSAGTMEGSNAYGSRVRPGTTRGPRPRVPPPDTGCRRTGGIAGPPAVGGTRCAAGRHPRVSRETLHRHASSRPGTASWQSRRAGLGSILGKGSWPFRDRVKIKNQAEFDYSCIVTSWTEFQQQWPFGPFGVPSEC